MGGRNVLILSACIDNASALNSMEVFPFFVPLLLLLYKSLSCQVSYPSTDLSSSRCALKRKRQQFPPPPLPNAERETATALILQKVVTVVVKVCRP